MQRNVIIFILCLLSTLSLRAQNPIVVGLNGSSGTILAHHDEMQYLVNKPVYTIEAECIFPITNNLYWNKLWRDSRFGASLFFSDLGDNQLGGFAYAVYPFIEIPFFSTTHHQINYRIGAGLAYLSSAFNPQDNYYQIAIGSHINIHVHYSISYRYRLNDNIPLSLLAGLNFNHFSNGGMEKPNLGFNLITARLGALYELGGSRIPLPESIAFQQSEKLHFHVYSGVALTKNFVYDTKYYLATNVQVFANWRFSPKRAWGLGVDIVCDNAIPYFYEDTLQLKLKNKLRSGIFISQQVFFTQSFIFDMQLGFYMYNPKSIDGFMYERLGFRYFVTEHFSVGFAVKAHAAVANGFETTVGWRF